MALEDSYIAKLTPGTKSTISNQYFDLNRPFAPPRHGNECTAYICGRDYMKAVAEAIRAAKRFIFIADWQLDYDVELDQRGATGHPGRLSELLANALQRGVHIRIICYDSVDSISHITASFNSEGPPDTHEEKTKSILEKLPQQNGSLKVILQNPNTGGQSAGGLLLNTITKDPSHPNIAFSHHQKFVVIDGAIAFLGGLDLAYGRWDTPACNVLIDPAIHVLNDAYNSQINASREATKAEISLTQGKNGHPGFRKPLYTSQRKLLDPLTQPRQPWADIGIKISGPSAYDVFVNFVLRWNSFASRGTNLLDKKLTSEWFEKSALGHEVLIDPLQQGSGRVNVQICRSASTAQLKDELQLWNPNKKYIHDDWKKSDMERRKTIQTARTEWANSDQTSIYDAMIQCIRAAQGYIYIENQFFVSDCGNDIYDTPSPSKNKIIEEIANSIAKAIYAERPFHVWIVLPEHPEGAIESTSVKSQLWWMLQGIKHASASLVNRINATLINKIGVSIKASSLAEYQSKTMITLKKHNMEHKWKDYLTILNLRNYGCSSENVLTEMIYVHSKLMIVDDAVAIIGSANINDRSLMGNGDTELAAVVVDTTDATITDLGQNVRCITRKFARELRIKLWKKHLGILEDETKISRDHHKNPLFEIQLESPLALKTIASIQQIAIKNRATYDKVFTHTPRSSFKTFDEGRKNYPNITKIEKAYNLNGASIGEYSPNGIKREPYIEIEKATDEHDFTKTPPLQKIFMKEKQHNIKDATAELQENIRGFFVEMPLDWGSGEATTPKSPSGGAIVIAENHCTDAKNNI